MGKPKVRVRYAPSPTGLQHLGGIRTALFSWLFAKQQKGDFILRIEDTDRKRYLPEAEQYIMDALRWLELDWQEGPDVGGKYEPYRQSERLDIYKKYADELLGKGRLYRCWCSAERLEELRDQAKRDGVPFKYDRHCLDKQDGDQNQPHTLRFLIDEENDVKWVDIVREKQGAVSTTLDDFVAMKSDGFPTYNFANVVDDYLMEITHVLRADEFIASTPKHIQIYQAFGWTPPRFGHVPNVLGPDKTPLSKRHGARPALEYKDLGYLPEAMLNFLATLGWNDGTTKEIYSKNELISAFSLDRIQKSPAVFDNDRLDYINGIHIRGLSPKQLQLHAELYLPAEAKQHDDEYIQASLGLVQERLKFLSELPELTGFFFERPTPDQELLSNFGEGQAVAWLEAVTGKLRDNDFTEESLEQALRPLVEELQTTASKLFQLIRVAVTGKTAAPGLFETLAVIGQSEVIARLEAAKSVLS